jgi:hypothetical protein
VFSSTHHTKVPEASIIGEGEQWLYLVDPVYFVCFLTANEDVHKHRSTIQP